MDMPEGREPDVQPLYKMFQTWRKWLCCWALAGMGRLEVANLRRRPSSLRDGCMSGTLQQRAGVVPFLLIVY